MNKIIFTTFFLLLTLAQNLYAGDGPLLFKIEKNYINVNSFTGSRNVREKMLVCTITSKGEATYDRGIEGKFYPELHQRKILSASDFKKFSEAIQNFDERPENYIVERDFTGDFSNQMGVKFVKSEDAYIFQGTKKINFYSTRRRLTKIYNGPGIKVIRKVALDYCQVNIQE